MHPDDDTIDAYEPYKGHDRRTPQPTHCSEHSSNMEFFRSVKTRQNILIGGVSFVILGMSWMYLTLYSMTSVIAVDSLKIANLEKGYLDNRADIGSLKTQQLSNEEWHRMMELREGMTHNGTERHHVGIVK